MEVVDANRPATYFAPAGRDTPEDFIRKVEVVRRNPLLAASLNAMPGMVMVLNAHRQIVAVNQAMLRILDAQAGDLLEKRAGEVVHCIHSQEGPDGCGTSRCCATCGAIHAILESQSHGAQVVRECRVLVDSGAGPTALDLQVAATSILVEGETFIVVAVEDISHAKRMTVLQRVFFHDVLNTAGCLASYADYLATDHDAAEEVSDRLGRLSQQLIEEIQAQRDLVLAEAGDLTLQVDMLATRQVLDELRLEYWRSPAAAERHIELGTVWSGILWTDRRLLMRILGNMLKNGLEAISPGQAITLHCFSRGDDVAFAVHNPGVMSDEVQLQIFQRSFSTKGQSGRGIGAYSMKLLGERYLGGRVEFVSRAAEGTTFTLTLPKARR